MRVSFGRFELDERSRSLRLDGQDRTLQPLVFDLLVYLVQHRERVVPKDELLSKLWDGATVTDGSLQRAVSLLRTVLREGDQEKAVQTLARRGYRFARLRSASPPSRRPRSARSRRRHPVGTRAGSLRVPARIRPRSLPRTGRRGATLPVLGHAEKAVAPLGQAVAAFERAGKLEAAARVALLLTNVKLEGRELPIARGWHERARGYLKGQPEGKQHGPGMVFQPSGAFPGRARRIASRARAATGIAERVGDPDLHCLGFTTGHILIAQGAVRRLRSTTRPGRPRSPDAQASG